MKVYVVAAQYCEDTCICGVALDGQTAEKIAACERATEGIKPDSVYVEEYDTDNYLPLNEGLRPFEVQAFLDRVEVAAADMSSFTPGSVRNGMRKGDDCLLTHVYARDKDDALLLAAALNSVDHEDVQARLDERRRFVMNTSYMENK